MAEIDRLDWHRYLGSSVMGLLVFRLYWGFFGSSTARFTDFVRRPGAVWAYARKLPSRSSIFRVGHNPLSGWSILAILVLLGTQVSLGLFAVDLDGLESGPLSHLVSFDAGRRLARAHRLTSTVLLCMALLHVSAVLFYWIYKRDNLIEAMLRGDRRAPEGWEAEASFVPMWRTAPGILLALACLFWLASSGS
jgi:cytochrome b